jgi:hypothetical protein
MWTAIFLLCGGLLTRADGWGPENDTVAASWPKWQRLVCSFFNVWSCSALFGLAAYLYTGELYAASAALAFLIWRMPGFHGWQNWGEMFWRGLWTAAIGFTIVGLILYNNQYYGFLCIPMGAAEALAYSGSYKWLPGRVPSWAVHVSAEISSGVFFTGFVTLILL